MTGAKVFIISAQPGYINTGSVNTSLTVREDRWRINEYAVSLLGYAVASTFILLKKKTKKKSSKKCLFT